MVLRRRAGTDVLSAWDHICLRLLQAFLIDMCVLQPISYSLLVAFRCRYLPPPLAKGRPARSRSRHLRSADALLAGSLPGSRVCHSGQAAKGMPPPAVDPEMGRRPPGRIPVYDALSGLGRTGHGSTGCPIRRGTVSRRRRRCPVPFGSGRPAGRTVRARPGRP